MRLLLLNFVGWGAYSVISALTSLNDDLRAGLQPDYWEIFKVTSSSALALALLSLIVYFCFSRWPRTLTSGINIFFGYGILLLFYLPLQLLFVIRLFLSDASKSISWNLIQNQILVLDRYSCLLHLTSITAVYFGVAAIKIWQRSHEREKEWALERAAILSLTLELEEQRMLSLRAQLEPHFVFNALNAISALVLSDSKDNALNGINGLSELLRYALTASKKNWVKFSDELAFLADYLNLQKLRYGERLQIVLEGVDSAVNDADCPPLLLQPLIENALRHDLDCHQNASDIHVRFSHDQLHLNIRISNAMHAEVSRNPGAGLGLRNTRARLQLTYGDQATLETCIANGRFQVDLYLPLYNESSKAS